MFGRSRARLSNFCAVQLYFVFLNCVCRCQYHRYRSLLLRSFLTDFISSSTAVAICLRNAHSGTGLRRLLQEVRISQALGNASGLVFASLLCHLRGMRLAFNVSRRAQTSKAYRKSFEQSLLAVVCRCTRSWALEKSNAHSAKPPLEPSKYSLEVISRMLWCSLTQKLFLWRFKDGTWS